MRRPADFDPDLATVLEIVQHAGEILSRLPLQVVRQHFGLEAVSGTLWHMRAAAMLRAAETFELAAAELSAEENRAERETAREPDSVWPDDALPSA